MHLSHDTACDPAALGWLKELEVRDGQLYEVFIFFASDAPTQYDPSFAKTFAVDASLVGAVKEYRDETSVSDVLAMDWTEDIQVVAVDAGRRITLS